MLDSIALRANSRSELQFRAYIGGWHVLLSPAALARQSRATCRDSILVLVSPQGSFGNHPRIAWTLRYPQQFIGGIMFSDHIAGGSFIGRPSDEDVCVRFIFKEGHDRTPSLTK